MNLPQRIGRFIGREKLFAPGDRLLVAASGGVDSTVLVHLLRHLGYQLAIAHCNYRLRGAASDGDADFVRQLADSYTLPYHEAEFDVGRLAQTGESTQMTARRLRYSYFEKILEEYNYDRIVTAHHLTDNQETQLINLLRGAGLRGLRGMRPRTGNLCRPLLETPAATIRTYARQQEYTFREDASNATNDYLRNQIRHQLLPVLTNLGLNDKASTGSFRQLRGEEGLFDWLHDRFREGTDAGNGIVRRADLPDDPAVALALLHRLASPYGLTGEQLRQLTEGPNILELDGSSGYVSANRNELIFKIGRRPTPPTTDHRPSTIDHLPFSCSLADGTTLHVARESRPADLTREGVQYLRPLRLPLHLRPRKNGDKFQPLGMTGHQKIKDFVINNKLDGDAIVLLCTDNGTIAAIVGHRIAEPFRVRPEDGEVLAVWVE